MKSFEPGGAKSMIAAPTAAIGEGTPTTIPANSSPTASATSAVTTPAIAASPRGATAGAVTAGVAGDGTAGEADTGWLMGSVSVARVTLA